MEEERDSLDVPLFSVLRIRGHLHAGHSPNTMQELKAVILLSKMEKGARRVSFCNNQPSIGFISSLFNKY